MDFHDIHTEGITKISASDIKYAAKMGRSIKLLASSRKTRDGYQAMVAPFMLSPAHPLYNVNDVFNAVFVRGNVLGDAMFYGSGAGKLPTASAVVADMIDIAKHLDSNIWVEWSSKKLTLSDFKEAENVFFVRTSSGKEIIEKVFGSVDYIDAGIEGECGFVTECMTEDAFAEKASEIKALSVIRVGK